jgi:hypothetical protein
VWARAYQHQLRPSNGVGTPFYGQVSRAGSTFHLTETEYVDRPGATVYIWMTGLDPLYDELNYKRGRVPVWGPAVWVSSPEEVPWGARVMTIADSFGMQPPTLRRTHRPQSPTPPALVPARRTGPFGRRPTTSARLLEPAPEEPPVRRTACPSYRVGRCSTTSACLKWLAGARRTTCTSYRPGWLCNCRSMVCGWTGVGVRLAV